MSMRMAWYTEVSSPHAKEAAMKKKGEIWYLPSQLSVIWKDLSGWRADFVGIFELCPRASTDPHVDKLAILYRTISPTPVRLLESISLMVLSDLGNRGVAESRLLWPAGGPREVRIGSCCSSTSGRLHRRAYPAALHHPTRPTTTTNPRVVFVLQRNPTST